MSAVQLSSIGLLDSDVIVRAGTLREMPFYLTAGLAAPDPSALLEQAIELRAFKESPREMYVDAEHLQGSGPWRGQWKRLMASARRDALALWSPEETTLAYKPVHGGISLSVVDGFENGLEGRAIVERFSFEVCSLGSVFFRQWIKANYKRWSFGRRHFDHGWGCAFRGAGHDRLVSRRWLDLGPWRVIRRPNDTTFIQFHDLAITDPAEAYEQAKVGHQRMGIDEIGGFIQGIDLDVIAEVQGVYRAEARTLEIVVPPGGAVSQRDIRVACGLRLHHRVTKPMVERVERIAYVFVDKGDAEAHLHELWLRELECWYLDGRGKHRIDAEYRPTPSPPAWVKEVEARGED